MTTTHKAKPVMLGAHPIANDAPLTLIAGPCVLESESHGLFMAEALKKIADRLKVKLIFKASFDKANRTSRNSFRGMGLEKALPVFERIKQATGLPLITDVHEPDQCQEAADVFDILQIPAFLCRQTDLLVAAAKTGKIINIKKGQFLAPWDMQHACDKVRSAGNPQVLLTERGTMFGYNRLVVDMRSLPIMAETGAPVIFDATHAVQEPGGQGGRSGGERRFVASLARAAVAVGVAGLFVETHNDPDNAPSDGPNMVPLDEFADFIESLLALDALVKSHKGIKHET